MMAASAARGALQEVDVSTFKIEARTALDVECGGAGWVVAEYGA